MVNIKKLSPDYSLLVSEGGFGDIYRCKENKDILVKVTKKMNDIFNGECNKKIIKKLGKHDNLMNIIGINDTKYGNIYLIFVENIHGINLSDYLNNYQINDSNIIQITKQILSGLQYLHKNKITHRDLKFENIIINHRTKKLKIIDFGLACYGYPCKGLVGTSGFFAPEMISSPDNYDSKCDIWSLGCMLYYMIAKTYPFHFTYDKSCYVEQLRDRVEIKYYDHKWKNASIKVLCSKMLVYDPSKRFSSLDCLNLLLRLF